MGRFYATKTRTVRAGGFDVMKLSRELKRAAYLELLKQERKTKRKKQPPIPLTAEQKAARSQKRKANMLATEATKQEFLQLLENNNIPTPQTETLFAQPRKFRADYFWRCNGIALMLELQGGVESNARSGHNSISGTKRDREKLNIASSLHIFTLQVSYKELIAPETIYFIKQILKI